MSWFRRLGQDRESRLNRLKPWIVDKVSGRWLWPKRLHLLTGRIKARTDGRPSEEVMYASLRPFTCPRPGRGWVVGGLCHGKGCPGVLWHGQGVGDIEPATSRAAGNRLNVFESLRDSGAEKPACAMVPPGGGAFVPGTPTGSAIGPVAASGSRHHRQPANAVAPRAPRYRLVQAARPPSRMMNSATSSTDLP